MKYFLPTLGVLFLATCGLALAQEQDQSGQQTVEPDEIITDFGIEEYLAIPKFTLSIGYRSISGVKSSFSGRGFVSSVQPTGDLTTPNGVHLYHDGNVLPDTEPYSFTITHADGTTSTYGSLPSPAGFTNTWSMLNLAQERPDGNIDFHSYTADSGDTGVHEKNPGRSGGMELVVARDMGKLGNKFEWKLLLGASLADLRSHTSESVNATITTITDTYATNLNGQPGLPTIVPYTAPSFQQQPQVDANGFPVYDATGAQIINYVETTVLLNNTPLGRTVTTTQGAVFHQWDLVGAYFTFRLGPSITYLLNDHLRFTLSAGAAIIYSGSNYTVTQAYVPLTGDPVTATSESDENKILPGYYVDGTVQYDITERAGFYAGVFYQANGRYTQTASLDDTVTASHASFKAAIDMSSLSGFRMGLNFKF